MLSWVNAVRITFIHDISWIWFNWISLSATVYSPYPKHLQVTTYFTPIPLRPKQKPIWRPKLFPFSTNNVKHHTEHSFISLTLGIVFYTFVYTAIYILRAKRGLGGSGANAKSNRIISSLKHARAHVRISHSNQLTNVDGKFHSHHINLIKINDYLLLLLLFCSSYL